MSSSCSLLSGEIPSLEDHLHTLFKVVHVGPDPVPHAALPDHGVQAGRVRSLLPGPVHQATRSSIEEPQWTGKAVLLPQLDFELEPLAYNLWC